MIKSIVNIGKVLDKKAQKQIHGGDPIFCDANGSCPHGYYCDGYYCKENHSSGGGGNGDNCYNPNVFCVNEFDTCCIHG